LYALTHTSFSSSSRIERKRWLPNPATLYLLEIYPYLLEHFHDWHRRMGIERSPLDSLPCC